MRKLIKSSQKRLKHKTHQSWHLVLSSLFQRAWLLVERNYFFYVTFCSTLILQTGALSEQRARWIQRDFHEYSCLVFLRIVLVKKLMHSLALPANEDLFNHSYYLAVLELIIVVIMCEEEEGLFIEHIECINFNLVGMYCILCGCESDWVVIICICKIRRWVISILLLIIWFCHWK